MSLLLKLKNFYVFNDNLGNKKIIIVCIDIITLKFF